MKRLTSAIIALVIVCLLGHEVFAATINVPADYTTIQAAIDVASDGDIVLLADGTYTGAGNKDLDFNGKAIAVRSENGPENCIIDCEGVGRGFWFHSGEKTNSILSGFTITNCQASSGAGILCGSSSPTIDNCLVNGNLATGSGGGISLSYSSPFLTNCIINNNAAYDGGGISLYMAYPYIINCGISDNTAIVGGGISGRQGSNVLIRDSIISGNTASQGGGIRFQHPSQRTYGPTMTNCIVSGNMATFESGGGVFSYNLPLTVTNCTFADNTASMGGAGIISFSSIPNSVTNSIFWDNAPDEIQGPSTVTYSDIQGGYPGAGNINADPLFVGGDDYHLTASSPCIDTGTSVGAPSEDMEGTPRPQGVGFDMGEYEYSAPGPVTASGLAKAVVGSPYLPGGKGWDFIEDEFVEAEEIGLGYYYYNAKKEPDPGIEKDEGLDCTGLVYW